MSSSISSSQQIQSLLSSLANTDTGSSAAFQTAAGALSEAQASDTAQSGAVDAEKYMAAHNGGQDAATINQLGEQADALPNSQNNIASINHDFTEMNAKTREAMQNGELDQAHGQEMLNAISFDQKEKLSALPSSSEMDEPA